MDKEFFMVYADGQNGVSTCKITNESEAMETAEALAEKLGKETIVLKAVAVYPKDITAHVKTYLDACFELGIEPDKDEVLTKLGFTTDEIAYRKLKTIAKALNEGWEPDWSNSNEYKYYPWFTYNGAYAGFSCALALGAATDTYASVGSRLCFKTRDLAAYAGKQFLSVYNDFLLINK
jgi:hypothetical protein